MQDSQLTKDEVLAQSLQVTSKLKGVVFCILKLYEIPGTWSSCDEKEQSWGRIGQNSNRYATNQQSVDGSGAAKDRAERAGGAMANGHANAVGRTSAQQTDSSGADRPE